MVAVGTWIRTIAALHPQQIWGRPSYKLRRAFAPQIATQRPWRMASPSIDEIPPPPTALAAGQLALLREGELSLAGLRSALPTEPPYRLDQTDPLFVYEFHQLSWLAGALGQLEADDPLAERLVGWLERYAAWEHPRASPYWDAYPLASRLLGLLPLYAAGRLERPAIERALHAWSVAILGLQETHLQGNHLLRSRAAAAAASLFLQGPGAGVVAASSWKALAREAERQFLPDGVHEERTPAYHLLCVNDLLVCFALAKHVGERLGTGSVETVERVASRGLAAAGVLTHADGRVSAFGDSAPESALRASDVRAFADALGVRAGRTVECSESGGWERRTAGSAGFSVLERSPLALYVSHGEFGAEHQPGHAHCDIFAFELDLDGQRVIVDPGVHAYHDPSWRERSRASSEHATPSVSGREQAEIWSRFRCGWRPWVEQARWLRDARGWSAELSAMAYGPDAIPLRRTMQFGADEVKVTDLLATPFSVALPLAPDVQLEGVSADAAVLTHAQTSRRLKVRVSSGALAIEPCAISHSFGARTPSQRLRLTSDSTARLSWSLQA